MKVSVALCTYNGSGFLYPQLESIANQTHQPYELIVCDDGSSDGTVAAISRFSSRVDFPVRLCRNGRTLGVTKNFEKAIAMCSGDLIALSDQDDEWSTNKLASFSRFFKEFPQALVAFSDADLIDTQSSPLHETLWHRLRFTPRRTTPHLDPEMLTCLFRFDNVVTGATLVIRSSLREKLFPIPDSWVHDAWIAWIAALNHGVGLLPEAKIRYRIHEHQQLGLGPQTFAERLVHTRTKAVPEFLRLIRQFEDLKLYLEQEEACSKKVIGQLEAKIHHLRHRAELPESFFARLFRVLSSWQRYQQYSRVSRSMLKDVFIPPRAASRVT